LDGVLFYWLLACSLALARLMECNGAEHALCVFQTITLITGVLGSKEAGRGLVAQDFVRDKETIYTFHLLTTMLVIQHLCYEWAKQGPHSKTGGNQWVGVLQNRNRRNIDKNSKIKHIYTHNNTYYPADTCGFVVGNQIKHTSTNKKLNKKK